MLRWTIITFALVVNLFGARPFATDDALPVEMGDYESEVGYEFRKKGEGTVSLGFAHGLTKRMEFGIGLEYLTGQVPSFSSPELSLKYELLTEWISVSFLSRFGESAYSLNGIITQTFGYFEIDGNCGYSVGDTTITYGVAVIYKMEKFDIGIETRGDREGLENWLIGGRYKIFEGFAVDFGLSREVSPETFKKTFGVHYEF